MSNIDDTIVIEKWKSLAIQFVHELYCRVNTPEMVGTDNETACLVMFCNAKHHDGKSTFVSEGILDRAEIRKILRGTLRELKHAEMVVPGREQ